MTWAEAANGGLRLLALRGRWESPNQNAWHNSYECQAPVPLVAA